MKYMNRTNAGWNTEYSALNDLSIYITTTIIIIIVAIFVIIICTGLSSSGIINISIGSGMIIAISITFDGTKLLLYYMLFPK